MPFCTVVSNECFKEISQFVLESKGEEGVSRGNYDQLIKTLIKFYFSQLSYFFCLFDFKILLGL